MAKKVEQSEEGGEKAKAIALIPKGKFDSYHKQAMILGTRIAKEAGELRELTGTYVVDHNLNSTAYGWIKTLAKIGKMEDQTKAREKIAAILASFDHMRNLLVIDGEHVDMYCKLQGRLFADGTGRASSEVKEESEEERDLRPRHLRQPGASASDGVHQQEGSAVDHVRSLAGGAGAKLPGDDDPLSKVGRGPQHKPH